MAGVKITDLGTLTTAVDADLLYIVDVSDTSESPQGTSKKIELSTLTSALDVASGIWTPTFSAFSGALITGTIIRASYSRVGSVITCTIYGEFEYDYSSLLNGSVTITLPIAGVDAIGVANFVNYENGGTGAVIGNVININAITTDPFSNVGEAFVAIFQYNAS
jgi:hypothetical protein